MLIQTGQKQNENPLSRKKYFAKLLFHFVDDCDVPLIFTGAMTSYSDEIYDRFPTTIFVTQYMIRVIGNQIAPASLPLLEVSSSSEFYCLKKYYVAFNVNTMN